MPVLAHSVPKYRKHRASGQAVVTLAGKDHYLGPYGTKASKVAYDRLVLEWLAAGRPRAVTPPQEEIVVKQVLAKFAQYAQQYYRKNGRSTGTAENYKPVIRLVRDLYGMTPAKDFGPIALKALITRMVDAGHSRRYVNDNVHRIKHIFRWAASEQLVSPIVSQALQTVAGLPKGRSTARESQPIRPVSDATVDATLPHLSPVVADMVRLQRLTGMRPGEVCQLRPCDLDRSGEVWRYVPQEHKTEHHGRQRVIFIGAKGQAILRPYLLRDAEDYCFSPKDSERKRLAARHAKRKTPLSCGSVPGSNCRGTRAKKLGVKFINDSYRRAIQRACEDAFGMPKELQRIAKDSNERTDLLKRAAAWRAANCWSPNQLRHTTATEVRHRFGLEAAQVVLGHSKADVTQIYAERNLELAARVAKEVG